MKQLPDDFRDFLSILNKNEVRYLIVGGWALGIHGYVRATGDMDIWIGLEDDNIRRLIAGLIDFGVPGPIPAEFFKEKGNAFRIGSPPMRIEIITEATGIDFEESYADRVALKVDDVSLPFLGYQKLVKNKRATGRLKDLADLEELGDEF